MRRNNRGSKLLAALLILVMLLCSFPIVYAEDAAAEISATEQEYTPDTVPEAVTVVPEAAEPEPALIPEKEPAQESEPAEVPEEAPAILVSAPGTELFTSVIVILASIQVIRVNTSCFRLHAGRPAAALLVMLADGRLFRGFLFRGGGKGGFQVFDEVG